MKKIAKLLKADFNESSDLASIAAMLTSKGRGNDTLLAHITPREAEILKAAGGSGTTNPETGLLEFFEDETASGYDSGGGGNTDEYGFVGTGGAVETQTPEASQAFGRLYPGEDRTIQPGANTTTTFPVIGKAYAGRPNTIAETQAAEDLVGGQYAGAVPAGQTITAGPLTGQTVYAPSPLSPMDLNRISVGATPEQQFKPTGTTPPQEKSFFDKLSTQDMVRLGLAGGLGIYGATQAKKGAKQAEAAAAELKAVGAPYQAKGQELIRAAESGELTPTGQQSLQALQARLAQGAESRGGVGAAQTAAQLEAYRNQLLSQQYNLGLQVSNIGDQIALGAIRTGLQADQALNQASTNFYTNLASIGAGIPMYDTRIGTQTRTA